MPYAPSFWHCSWEAGEKESSSNPIICDRWCWERLYLLSDPKCFSSGVLWLTPSSPFSLSLFNLDNLICSLIKSAIIILTLQFRNQGTKQLSKLTILPIYDQQDNFQIQLCLTLNISYLNMVSFSYPLYVQIFCFSTL